MRFTFIQCAFVLALAAAFFIQTAPAKAELTIAPLRVVFQERDKTAQVSVINLSNTVNTYRMVWTRFEMKQNGQYKTVPLDEKNANAVENMVVFTPKQVTIRPEQHQVIRLSLRRPADLPPGEYRAHLQFTRLPREQGNEISKEDIDPSKKPKGSKIEVRAAVSFSIPIIVRSGVDDELKVTLRNPKFANERINNKLQPVLKMDLTRDSGTFSTYGTIIVYWKKPGESEERTVGILNNVILYPEIKSRPFSVIMLGEQIKGGNLRIVYRGKYESQGVVFDEQIIPLAD